MNSCKTFAKNHPIILVVLTMAFVYGLLKLTGLIEGPLSFGISETVMAVVVVIVTILFMGKEKVRFDIHGFGYGSDLLRGYLIFIFLLSALGVVGRLMQSQVAGTPPYQLIGMINILLAGLSVGIVEEFTFRGLIFGGLLQKLGNEKKNIVLAAFLSGLLFGVMHVIGSIFAGEITDSAAVITAILKTLQTGVFGIVLAFIYYKTRNLLAIAALHSLDDLLLFIASDAGNTDSASYVANGSDDLVVARIAAYVFFTLILVPSIVRCIRDITPGEAIPFDEDFLPRSVTFKKKSKKKKKEGAV